MSEIFNLHTLCRCCHKDGKFRSLQLCYVYETELEMYATMLRETFNINMNMPTIDASNSICDDCIKRLRDAASFKRQVLDCEQKFQLYCKNEQALIIKEEITYDYDDDNNDKDSVEEGNLVVDESYNDDTQCKAEHPDESSVKDCKPEGNYYWEVKIEDEWEQTETVIQNPNNTEDREVKESVRKKMRKTIKDTNCKSDAFDKNDVNEPSQGSQNIIIETGHHQDQLNTRHTINVIVNNNKKERQKRYREQNRDKLKQREAERRKRIQYSQSIAGPSTSSKTNRIELNNEEIITAQSSSGSEKIQPSSIQRNDQGNELNALQKKRERQKRYREQNRDKLKQREAERRRRLQNADVITELSTSPNIEFTEIINDPTMMMKTKSNI
ncbi:uncharacterized protein [Epargyreus clarus]|uniref:uncharacterized protein isoform X4 n=1 Tax=Epargyreus clarus TaxID=520877 RepID=UPI003C2B2F8D